MKTLITAINHEKYLPYSSATNTCFYVRFESALDFFASQSSNADSSSDGNSNTEGNSNTNSHSSANSESRVIVKAAVESDRPA